MIDREEFSHLAADWQKGLNLDESPTEVNDEMNQDDTTPVTFEVFWEFFMQGVDDIRESAEEFEAIATLLHAWGEDVTLTATSGG